MNVRLTNRGHWFKLHLVIVTIILYYEESDPQTASLFRGARPAWPFRPRRRGLCHLATRPVGTDPRSRGVAWHRALRTRGAASAVDRLRRSDRAPCARHPSLGR